MIEKNIREIVFFIKHLPGLHDQNEHGNRYHIINGKPKLVHVSIHAPVSENVNTSNFDSLSLKEKSDSFTTSTENWKKALTSNERSGIVKYVKTSYGRMNRALRNESYSDNSTIGKAINNAQKGLLKGNLDKDINVYRCIRTNGKNSQAIINALDVGIGNIFVDKSFCSTSLDKNTSDTGFSGKIKINIIVPKGSKGAYVQSFSKYKNEYEYLLPHGTSFKLISHEVHKKNTHIFTMKVVSSNYDNIKSL
jgi:hypothetical protein